MMITVAPAVERLALFVATMLNKLQVERSDHNANIRVFPSECDALIWLRAGDAVR